MLKTINSKECAPERLKLRVPLEGEASTKVHVVKYDLKEYTPKVIVFDKPRRLLDWCTANDVPEAIAGGFFCRRTNRLLGDTWEEGRKRESLPVASPWESVRGVLYVDRLGKTAIGSRAQFPDTPENDLLQAGPVLVQNGVPMIREGIDKEGFSAASYQFDTDITIGRYPRTAIGLNNDYVWSVVCDGRSSEDVGMTLAELADFMTELGASEALNLDGGGTATQISDGAMQNMAVGDNVIYARGRELLTAIAFVGKQ